MGTYACQQTARIYIKECFHIKDYMMDEIVDTMIALMGSFRHKLILPFEQSHRGAISRMQYNTLRRLRETGPLSISDLAAEINVSKQQMTPIISKLLEKNLIQRTVNATDHRSTLISLTEDGFALLTAIKTRIKAILKERLRQVDDAELATLRESLENLNRLLERLF